MDWGFNNRLSKLILEDGHCFYLAMDHGYFQGPTHGLEQVERAFEPLQEFVDAVFVPRGSLRHSIKPNTKTPIILRVSGGNSIISKDLSNEEVSVGIDEILRLNVSAVGYSVYIGSEYEHQTLMGLNKLVDACAPYGIPVMAVTAVGREMDQKKEARFLSMACRVCAEAGADVVKTYFCNDFEKVVNGCPVPVVIAGGPKTDSELEVLKFVYDGMQKGAIGVNLGRNIWQNVCPRGMARALKAVIHEKATPKEAFELFEHMKNAIS
ncbi:MAG: 3-hydroxy-5-phosphonooxypentane-2,4-dione thiolase [Anaerolineaceae bacterium]|jgi:putative autoinducer-2 (AI-2) aldolase